MPQQPGRTMTRFLIVALASALATLAIAQSANDKSVTRLDPALDALVSPDAKVELVKGGFGFTEGPVWVQEGTTGYLLFTDIPGNVVWKLTADGQASVFASNVGYTGPEVWRWGGIQNNGFDRSDPGAGSTGRAGGAAAWVIGISGDAEGRPDISGVSAPRHLRAARLGAAAGSTQGLLSNERLKRTPPCGA